MTKCIEGFLELAFDYDWDKAKKMPQYWEREIQAEIRGFNKAQEYLRGILELNGTPTAAQLAEIRSEGQVRPEKHGKLNIWMGS